MAIIILGQSTCPICGCILQADQDVVGLPAFDNQSHDLSRYSDSGFHTQCYMAWNRRDEIETIIEATKEKDQYSEYFKKMLLLHGPPKTLEHQFVHVIHSFKLSNEMIIVFLKWNNGELPDGTILDDLDGTKWCVKQYFKTSGSFKNHEKKLEDEKHNIFQYLLDPIIQNKKPMINTFLKITEGSK